MKIELDIPSFAWERLVNFFGARDLIVRAAGILKLPCPDHTNSYSYFIHPLGITKANGVLLLNWKKMGLPGLKELSRVGKDYVTSINANEKDFLAFSRAKSDIFDPHPFPLESPSDPASPRYIPEEFHSVLCKRWHIQRFNFLERI